MRRWHVFILMLVLIGCGTEEITKDEPEGQLAKAVNYSAEIISATVSQWRHAATVPAHSLPVSFNPTSIKEIEAARPGAGIDLIEPPRGNSSGDARLSYPIEIPPGRNGMQPDIAIRYDSSKGNGWLGVGWNIAAPAIEVDTRFGVPRYDAAKETETYLLDGKQLTPVAHRGALKDRVAEKVFHARVEGQFCRIVRHGNHPSNYWWEVTDKNGTRYFYGGGPDAGGPTADSTLANPLNGHIFRWCLREVRDTWGNAIKYTSLRVSDVGLSNGVVPGWQLYLQEISYTGFGGSAGLYSVHLIRDRDMPDYDPSMRRPDVIIDARSGFKMVTADLLKRIEVRFNGGMIRSYELEYQEGAFHKSLVKSITQFGKNGEFFHKHQFEYFDEIRDGSNAYVGFAAPAAWVTHNDNVGAPLLGQGQASALGGASAISGGPHLYVGFNPTSPSKENSAGGKVGYVRSTNYGELELVDIDGDSLPDKVFRDGAGISYRRNLSGPTGPPQFDPIKRDIPSLPYMLEEASDTVTAGAEGYLFKAYAMADYNHTFTTRSIYLTDVNGDGSPDLVNGGSVLFSHLNAQNIPTFTPNSADTPVPIESGQVDTTDLIDDFSQVFEDRVDTFPLIDSVRRWVAPYSGQISITGQVQLLEDTSQAGQAYQTADGVRVAIQHNGVELWSANIPAKDYAARTPIGVDAVPVARGDRVYFRVQSVFDGAYDQVAWAPEINYVGTPVGTVDANLLDPYHYSGSADFVLAGRGGKVQMPYDGTVRISGDLTKKAVTSDDIALLVIRNGNDVVISKFMAWHETGIIPLQEDLDVTKSDVLEFHVRTDSPIDVTQIEWVPNITYIVANGVPSVTDPDGNYFIQIDPPYDVDLYPESDLTAPPQPWVALATGTIEVTPQLMLLPFLDPFDSELVLTVKRGGELLGKSVIVIQAGVVQPPSPGQIELDVTEDDELFFDYSTRHGQTVGDIGLAPRLASTSVHVAYSSGPPIPPVNLAVALNSPAEPQAFNEPYRGWSFIAYNGNRDWATQPIDESVLFIDKDYTLDNARIYVQTPFPGDHHWRSSDDLCWVAAGEMSSSRLGMDYIQVPRPADFVGARAVPALSSGNEFVVGAGFYVGGSYTVWSSSEGELDYVDMNGDSFPDVVGKNRIQYTQMTGGLDANSLMVAGTDPIRYSDNSAWSAGFNIAGNPVSNQQDGKGRVSSSGSRKSSSGKRSAGKGSAASKKSGGSKAKTSEQGNAMPELGFGGELAGGTAVIRHDLADLNGDGLPDRVHMAGPALMVALNLGYGFAPPEPWGLGIIDDAQSSKWSLKGDIGFNDGIYGFGGGASFTRTDGRTNRTLIDMNGDGLVDIVASTGGGLVVALNTGAAFATPVPWQGGCNTEIAANANITLGGGAYFTIGIGPLCKVGCYIIINPGGSVEFSMSRSETTLTDINGDGYMDHLHSTSDSSLSAALNRTGRTNLLKKVIRPMGAEFTLGYARDGNTMDHPPSRWNLSRVEVLDGQLGDGPDAMVTTYRYEQAVDDSLEREYFGYALVAEEHRDPDNADALYRTITRTYNNSNYYNKELLAGTLIQDSASNKFIETINTYELIDISTGLPVIPIAMTTATVFPQLTRTDKLFYEGQPTAQKATYVTYQYDALGNVTECLDVSDVGPADDLLVHTDYFADPAAYIVGRPNLIIAMGNGTEMRHCEMNIEPGTGAVRQVRRLLESGQVAITDLDYYPNGNLRRVTGPPNLHGQRYALDMEYDPDVQTHVASVEDSFGYRSTTTYNPHYAAKDVITDINGHQIDLDYDSFGRLQSVRGPYQAGGPATIVFEYHPEAAVPWALTRRIDAFRDLADPIDTIIFTDGLKRLLQTKKDAAVAASPGDYPDEVMIVSGRLTFDFVGRIVRQYYPIVEQLGTPGGFNSAYDGIAPTRHQYDVLDRMTRVTRPSGSFMTRSYGFGPGRNSILQFEALATDAKGVQKRTYRDLRNLITSILEANDGGAELIWTSYAYDALRQIVRIEDDMHNVTHVVYDSLGRRTFINSPDSGNTETMYDLADNIIAKITSNLRGQGQAIQYDYDFSRPSNINYPGFPGNNVTYTYGGPGASFNRAGRIVQVTDQSGAEQRFYGKLGEIVKEIKTVASDTQGASANSPEIYTTEYTYDTWGRIQELIYPDGEELIHAYDSGGLLAFASGVKNGVITDYIKRLEYDKFQERVFFEVTNGVTTEHVYDPVTRRLVTLRAGVGGKPFQNVQLTYDIVGNILEAWNDVDVPPPNCFGGPVLQNFAYDDLRRLLEAEGSHMYAPRKLDRYSLTLSYNTIHNITRKNQSHELVQPSGQPVPQHDTTYAWSYHYDGPQPHAPTHLGDRTYSYDRNGNQLGWDHDHNGTRRDIVWDEENRAQFIDDNGHTKSYRYDHAGQRAMKCGPQGETAYVNPYFTIRNRSVATKHFYAGASRVASKLCPGYDRPPARNGLPETNFLYFYHPDHLGSSMYVTDGDGELYEHLQYFPFGETWVEEKSNTQRTPYRFTAKELDEETSLYWREARYYDPRTCIWQNADSVLQFCLDGRLKGGVYDTKNLSVYAYSHQNPIRYLDGTQRKVPGTWSQTRLGLAASPSLMCQSLLWPDCFVGSLAVP